MGEERNKNRESEERLAEKEKRQKRRNRQKKKERKGRKGRKRPCGVIQSVVRRQRRGVTLVPLWVTQENDGRTGS